VTTERRKPRLAVITPFLDKNHGTELHVVEWITFLLDSFEIHIYSQQVEDVDLKKSHWHRIPKLPGPHLLNYLWWFCANHLWRAFDHYFRGIRYDLVFSPGINCLDADVISVHIVFAEYAGKNREANSFSRHPVRDWPRLLHRRLYYRLLIFLEQRIYTHREITLILIARKTLKELWRFYARSYGCPVLYTGLDPERFEPQRRQQMRRESRAQIGLAEDSFAVVLVGNDWLNKGVPVLLKALALLPDAKIELLVVSREDSAPARAMASSLGVEGRVHFLPPRKDVEFYYAAADAYAGPSLEDTFALPPAEAMACGLPVIVSSANGTSEIITNGVNGLILGDPADAAGLAAMIRHLANDEAFRTKLAENAALTAQNYTWERNGHQLSALFEEILQRKELPGARKLAQGPTS
jgi:UDP-glucose:(heptosyl)LPS alpha-1,3-glucosyltransferase